MEDKILIQSEFSQKAKNFLRLTPLILFGITILCLVILTLPWAYTHYGWITYTTYESGWYMAFHLTLGPSAIICFILFLICCLSFVLAIITGILCLVYFKGELSITENNVKAKTLFGKEVVLPICMISAYSTRKLFSTIAISTTSGITKFLFIKNYAEIANVLAKKINERQNITIKSTKIEDQNNNANNIV